MKSLLTLLIMFPVIILAQTSIKGLVIDLTSSDPIIYTTVDMILGKLNYIPISILYDENQKKTSLYGILYDSERLSPILFGTVALKKNESIIMGVETDLDGKYYFLDVTPGVYDLETSYVGYTPTTIRDIRIFSEFPTQKNITITEGQLAVDYEPYCRCCNPIIEFDKMESGMTITSEDIKRMPIPK